MKKLLLFIFMVLFASSMFAQTTVWNPAANPTPDSLWTTEANWTEGLPVGKTVFNVPDAWSCILNAEVTIEQLVQGDGGPGDTLIIAAGGILNTGAVWSGIGWNDTATLIVEVGGIINFGSHMWTGHNDGAIANIQIYGTVNYADNLGLGKAGGTSYVAVHGGGILSGRYWSDDSIGEGDTLDIRGGTVKLQGDRLAIVNPFIEAGKIVAHGGEGIVKVDLVDGETVITAVAAGTALWSPAEGGSGLWNDAANWLPAQVPLDTNRVLFSRANVQECTLDFETTVKRIEVGAAGSDGGTLRLKAGAILNLIEDDSYSSIGQTHSGTLILEAGAVINKADDRFDIGNQVGSNGTVTIDGGDLNIYDMNLGRVIGATGSLTINSGTLTGGKSLDIADHGTGTLTMNGGDIILADDLYIAKSNDDTIASTGTLTMNGGKIYMVEDMKAGNGGLGILTLNDGIIEIGDRLYIGEAGGKAEIYIKGGEFLIHDKIKVFEGEGFIDITDEGKVILDGDQVDDINEFVTAGQIVSAAGEGTVNVALVDGNTVVTGTGTGSGTAATTIDNISFELKNYPNPVGNMTHISYSLENKEHVTINVYNISGKLINTLVSEMQLSGTNIIDYDTSSLKNGVYLLNLRTGSRSVTTKFLK
jgi:hypothetical protein